MHKLTVNLLASHALLPAVLCVYASVCLTIGPLCLHMQYMSCSSTHS
jgi:hypothetical protein